MTKHCTSLRFDGLYWAKVEAEWRYNTEGVDYFLYLCLSIAGEATLTSSYDLPESMTQWLFEERCQQACTTRGIYTVNSSSIEIKTFVDWRKDLGTEERFSGVIGSGYLNVTWDYKFIQEGKEICAFTRPMILRFVGY